VSEKKIHIKDTSSPYSLKKKKKVLICRHRNNANFCIDLIGIVSADDHEWTCTVNTLSVWNAEITIATNYRKYLWTCTKKDLKLNASLWGLKHLMGNKRKVSLFHW